MLFSDWSVKFCTKKLFDIKTIRKVMKKVYNKRNIQLNLVYPDTFVPRKVPDI